MSAAIDAGPGRDIEPAARARRNELGTISIADSAVVEVTASPTANLIKVDLYVSRRSG